MGWPENVRKSDLRIEYYRGSGKGGQHRNKRDTACRITHKETGTSACSEEHKSQEQNRRAAFKRLANQLVPMMKEKLRGKVEETDSSKRIRTYHAIRGTVRDDRIPGKQFDYDKVLDGDLDEIMREWSNG